MLFNPYPLDLVLLFASSNKIEYNGLWGTEILEMGYLQANLRCYKVISLEQKTMCEEFSKTRSFLFYLLILVYVCYLNYPHSTYPYGSLIIFF